MAECHAEQPDARREPLHEGRFDPITREAIDVHLADLHDRWGIVLPPDAVAIEGPGDDFFDSLEIITKLEKGIGSWADLQAVIREYKPAVDERGFPTPNEFRRIARERGIVLDGRVPGFAMTRGDRAQIVFLTLRGDEVLPMAEKYAAKQGEADRTFADREGAGAYLRELSSHFFNHEVAHVLYESIPVALRARWELLVASDPTLVARVIEVQRDKYETIGDMPIAEEAFADYAIEVLSDGATVSRLGRANAGTLALVREMLNTAAAHE